MSGTESATVTRVNLAEKFASIDEHWSPKIVAHVSGLDVKLAKLQGEFVWHSHPAADELFLVVQGRLCIQLRDGEVWLEPGECAVIPRGVEHRPVAQEEVQLLLVEPAGTLNTGDAEDERTVHEPERI